MPTDLPIADRSPNPTPPGDRAHLLDMTLSDLEAWLAERDQPRYRAKQVMQWIYEHHAHDFEQMTNLPKTLRARLTEEAVILRATVATESVANDGTRKLLLQWPDGGAIETVLIPEADRNTACLSSQVGCPVGCKFCASGVNGAERSLTVGEIVEQALRVSRMITSANDEEEGARLSNIVMMGMGEPLANYANVLAAIRILNAPWALNIGARKITLSTVGLPQQIRKLANEDLQLNLALSLHAPEDALRRELIPWGKMPITELLDACREYFRKTGREITLEYVLLADVNDQPHHAVKLAQIVQSLRANVNLLRYNPVAGLPYARPSAEVSTRFQKLLRERGVNAHIRRSRGRDIDAACGQLRRQATPSRSQTSTTP